MQFGLPRFQRGVLPMDYDRNSYYPLTNFLHF